MSLLESEIRQRLTRQFHLLAQGDDAPPGPRYRLEGLMEAAVISGEIKKEALQALIENLHQDIFAQTIEARLGEDWEQWHPFPQIPAFALRAPVSPSTSD
ncbi:hypothetical protein R0135_14875 [Congregibacter variabilis]|uniref:Uncharacterized protein n=1 Tax=Congregibacter variabilis TaxID=3081200 RepID=A0ABZ0I0M6_9GAMM|nr:hypothetical protein R0135_14875 [Congregibacter sp. IMCC43200]